MRLRRKPVRRAEKPVPQREITCIFIEKGKQTAARFGRLFVCGGRCFYLFFRLFSRVHTAMNTRPHAIYRKATNRLYST